jgi:hypothetical protein
MSLEERDPHGLEREGFSGHDGHDAPEPYFSGGNRAAMASKLTTPLSLITTKSFSDGFGILRAASWPSRKKVYFKPCRQLLLFYMSCRLCCRRWLAQAAAKEALRNLGNA